MHIDIRNGDLHWDRCRVQSSKSSPSQQVHLSADCVFDGTKPPYTVESRPNPLSEYGCSAAQGEKSSSVDVERQDFDVMNNYDVMRPLD